MKRFDVVVIGSGAAGLTAAFTANGLGKKVALIDHNAPGGECTWSGCIPSKALVHLASESAIARKQGAPAPDTEAVMNTVREASQNIYQHETPEVIASAGVTFIQGSARFVSPHELSVAGKTLYAKKIILATGSTATVPPIEGIHSVPYLTNDRFFQQTQLPSSMLVLGGGSIAVELGQAMAKLGVRVTLIEQQTQLLAREEAAFAHDIQARLEADGVDVRLGHRALNVVKTASGVKLESECQGQKFQHFAERLLVAAGRTPVFEKLNLAAADINTDRGVTVNRYLQTSQPHIYACGDLIGPYQLSHMANYQAKIAARNAVFPFRKKATYEHVCWTLFCDPEFARTGLTEAEARQQHQGVRVYEYDLGRLDRARIQSPYPGRIKIILDRKGYVLGGHILGERAGELITQVQTFKTLKLPFRDLQQVIHPYPTFSDALRQISQQVWIDDLQRQPVVRLAKAVSRLLHRPG
jgi:pyruvate/2-oxoglutarate dehydrogenase complex dihydrolipoamide dehydrogenase (E3) component